MHFTFRKKIRIFLDYLFILTDNLLNRLINSTRALVIRSCYKNFFLLAECLKLGTQTMSDKEEMASDGSLNVTLTLRLLMHGKVIGRYRNS